MISKEDNKKLKEKFCPLGSDLQVLQEHLNMMLVHFDEICKKNNIRYWLSSGTCLGAVRHGGFIPWDDDVDVEMQWQDYKKFMKAFKEDDMYVVQSHLNDLYYTQPFPKLRLKNSYMQEGEVDKLYKYRGLFLDIFVVEKVPLFVTEFCHVLCGSIRHLSFKIKKRNWLIDALFFILKSIVFSLISVIRFSTSWIPNNVHRLALGTGYGKNVRPNGDIFPTIETEFEEHLYPVPGNVDIYLRRLYGDYMKIPREIHTHSLHNIKYSL